MELKEFIKAVIVDATDAVRELQSELGNGAIVNPTLPNTIATKTLTVEGEIRPIEHIAFDIAVTATEMSGISGNAKAGISVFGVKAGTESSATTEKVSRLTFSIPIVFPASHVKTQQEILREKRPKKPVDY